MIPIGIIGASGFTRAELLRLCAQHPEFEVRFATGDPQRGTAVADLYPSLAGGYPDLVLEAWAAAQPDGFAAVFLGLPDGTSQAIVPDLLGRVRVVVDLGADFRLQHSDQYVQWYGAAHTVPDLLDRFVYGLPELYREQLRGTDCVATPGCY